MKIARVETLISVGAFPRSSEWARIRAELHAAIRAVDWPPKSGSFTIYPESGKRRREANGVTPIKVSLMVELAAKGWHLERPFDVGGGRKPGKFDAVYLTKKGPFALEWETDNISSSHRALNKMGLGLIHRKLIGGTLVVPTRSLYQYLTDRVGNYDELVPYFDLRRSVQCTDGVLEIAAIEHDATSTAVPRIPKGTSGRALE